LTCGRRNPPGRIAYVDGRYLNHGEAGVHVEDRGLQFGDAVYEVFRVENARLYDFVDHMERLERSLRELSVPMPMSRAALGHVMAETVRRNRVEFGLVYLQVTRGCRRRDFPIPDPPLKPTVIVTAHGLDREEIACRLREGVSVVTCPDIRWGRCDIKTTQLLAGLLAKTHARRKGAFEAWLVDGDGYVTEGASSNAWIVTADGKIITRDLSRAILPGVTRRVMLEAAAAANMPVEKRKFTPAEVAGAREAFLTASTGPAVPVISIDGAVVGDGRPGPVTKRIATHYFRHSQPDDNS
jgi:D-alanine transaminase